MSRVYERRLMVLLHKDQLGAFEDYVNAFDSKNSLSITSILDQDTFTKAAWSMRLPLLAQKYNPAFIQTFQNLHIKDDSLLLEKDCLIWARDVNYLFPAHVEIEILISVHPQFQDDIPYQDLARELGEAVEPRMVYEITDFEHYELWWFQGQPLHIKISNIESAANIEECLEALFTMEDNLQVKWYE